MHLKNPPTLRLDSTAAYQAFHGPLYDAKNYECRLPVNYENKHELSLNQLRQFFQIE
jgi:hypothetical protein